MTCVQQMADYERRFDGGDAASGDEENVCKRIVDFFVHIRPVLFGHQTQWHYKPGNHYFSSIILFFSPPSQSRVRLSLLCPVLAVLTTPSRLASSASCCQYRSFIDLIFCSCFLSIPTRCVSLPLLLLLLSLPLRPSTFWSAIRASSPSIPKSAPLLSVPRSLLFAHLSS
jgi:hypothetical protein